MCGEMLVTVAEVSSVVRLGIMHGRETLTGADPSVVVRITGGGGLTTAIIVKDIFVRV